jgi:hypothetical protein
MPSYSDSPIECANCCSVTVPYLSSAYSGSLAATSAVVLPPFIISMASHIEAWHSL